MAFDERRAQRVRQCLGKWEGLTEKKMFGGLAFLIHGNMGCAIRGTELMVRLGPVEAPAALAEPGTRVFDITGRPMKGWLLVSASAIEDDAVLDRWVRRGAHYAATLARKRADR